MFKRIDSIIEQISNWLLVITGIAVCVLIFAGAVMRHVFHSDFYGSEELILVAAFWLYFIGSSMAAKHDTQIRAEMLDMIIKNKTLLSIANIVKYIINLAMSTIASIWSIQYVLWNINMNVKSNVFRFPVAFAVLPIAISFVLWAIYCLRDLINAVKGLRKTAPFSEPKEEADD